MPVLAEVPFTGSCASHSSVSRPSQKSELGSLAQSTGFGSVYALEPAIISSPSALATSATHTIGP